LLVSIVHFCLMPMHFAVYSLKHSSKMKRIDNYGDAERFAKFVVEFKCSSRNCGRRTWWGSPSKAGNCRCGKPAAAVPLGQQVGLGWFRCTCGRTWASVAKGSGWCDCKAASCGKRISPDFFTAPDKGGPSGPKKQTHSCSLCHGNGSCPLLGGRGNYH
jgi:hypothetical protein